MSQSEEFAALMARLRAGDDEAASQIFGRFAQQLIALARSRLDPLLRRKEDPEDVIQSVFRTFFARQADGRLQVNNWQSLWGLLTAITLRKCGHRLEYYQAACRNVGRERSPVSDEDHSATDWEALDSGPSPSQVAMLSETVQQLLQELNERDQQIVQLSLQGAKADQISTALGCSERTVKRVLERIRQRLEQSAGGTEHP